MHFYFITFRSITFAQRAEKLLNQKGMRAGIQRTPRWMEEQGCGYAVKVWMQEIAPAVKLLREHRILLRRVYAQTENGQMEEVFL